MAKIVLNDLSSLQNEQSVVSIINGNNTTLETFSNSLLSRDGTSPNSMGVQLDMNNHQIINLPLASQTGNAVEFNQWQTSIDTYIAGQETVNAQIAATEADLVLANALLLGTQAIYLGISASNPVSAVAGAIYYNSVAQEIRIWTGASWVTAAQPLSTGVTSFNSRTGSVIATAGDYASSQVTNDSSVSGSTSKDALNTLLASIATTNGNVSTNTTNISTNTSSISTLSSNKLDSSSYTAADVLTKIKTVDGTGSGLDADTIDGLDSTALSTVLRTQSTKTSNYSVVQGDSGNVILINGAINITLPTGITVGTQIDFINISASTGTFVAGSGASLNAASSKVKLSVQYTTCSAIVTGTSTWCLFGSLTT